MSDISLKQDNTELEPRVMYHEGFFSVINMTYTNIYDVVITHRQSGGYITEYTIDDLPVMSLPFNGPKRFEYVTGNSTPFDYWYIQYRTGPSSPDVYGTKTNFYCSLTGSDNGNVVILIRPGSAKIIFSSSSGCTVSIDKIK